LCSAILASCTSFYYYTLDFVLALCRMRTIPDRVVRFFTVTRFIALPVFVILIKGHVYSWGGAVFLFALAADIRRFKDKARTEQGLNLTADKMLVLSLFLIAYLAAPASSTPGSMNAQTIENIFFYLVVFFQIILGFGLWKLWKKKYPFPTSRLGQLSLWMCAVSIIDLFLEHTRILPPETLQGNPALGLAFVTSLLSAFPLFRAYINICDAPDNITPIKT